MASPANETLTCDLVAAHLAAGDRNAAELVVETDQGPLPALAYVAVVGRPHVGDRVLLNTTALTLDLGTGGYAMVVAVPDRLPADNDGPGHVVKARYTPTQTTVLAVDEQGSPHHDVLRDADDIGGMPVVVDALNIYARVLTERGEPFPEEEPAKA